MPKPRLTTLLLIVILTLAAVLRLGWPGLTEFKYDEATIARLALALVHEGRLPTHGLTSSLVIPHPPLTAYLLAIPFAISRDPALAVLFSGALGVVAVWLTYVLGRRYFGERVGLLAAALFASAPWAIFYSRKIWSQNVPAISLGFMLALYAVVVERKPKALIWALLGLGALMGLHLGGVAFAVIFALTFALHPRALRVAFPPEEGPLRKYRRAAIGLAGLLLLMAPYVMEFASGQTSLQDAFARAQASTDRAPLSTLPARFAAGIATGHQFHALAGSQHDAYYASLPLPNLNNVLDLGEVWLILLGMAYVVVRAAAEAFRREETEREPDGVRRGARYTILALWIVVTIAMWTASRGEILPHHFIQLYPAQHLALAVLLVDTVGWLEGRAFRRRGREGEERDGVRRVRIGSALLAVGVAVLWTWQTVEYVGMLRFISEGQATGGHSVPAREVWGAAREARRLAAPDDLPIVVHTIGDDPEQEGGAAAFDALLGDLDLYLIEGEAMEVYPASEYVWVSVRADGTYDVEVRPAPETGEETLIARLVNGVDLAGVSPDGLRDQIVPGEDLPLTLEWRLWGLPPTEDNYSFTVQLMTDDWLRWGQVDDHFLRTEYWHPGDRVTTSVRLPVSPDAPPDGTYRLVIAMYTYLSDNEQQNVDVIDPAGNPAGRLIVIPLD